jgi:DNA-binding LacI/PurR family transcriptional regulator
MVEHLIATGRRRIATIAGPQDTPGGQQRLAGYRAALDGRYDPALVVAGDYSRGSGTVAARRLLAAVPDLDAIFAANDRMAAAAIDVLVEAGRQVPTDVAVAGFDDSPVATRTEPALTTMRQPFDRISREMVRLLLAQIDGEQPGAVILPTELVIRRSA